MHALTNLILHPDDFTNATVTVDTNPNGHIAAIRLDHPNGGGHITIQASGDGTRTLAEGLRQLADRLEAERTAWLRAQNEEAA